VRIVRASAAAGVPSMVVEVNQREVERRQPHVGSTMKPNGDAGWTPIAR
jgi:hypothetical protein